MTGPPANSSYPTGIAEENPQIPRRVKLDGITLKAFNFGILLFLCGFTLLVWISLDSAKNLLLQRTLLREGRLADGTVVASYVNRGGTEVKYKFMVDGVPYSGHAEMSSDPRGETDDGSVISIRYMPADPHINQPLNWKWASVWDLFPFLLLVFLTGIGANVINTALTLRNLARNGLIVAGRVTGCTPNKGRFRVYYVFTSNTKEEIEGSCDLSDKYEAGDEIQVIYLPRNSRRNTRYPIAGYYTTR